MKEPILEVKGLKKYFGIYGGVFGRKIGEAKAVDDVNFSVNKGEVLGIVGESGCGKSTTGKSLLRLIEPTEGEILFENKDIMKFSNDEMRKARKDLQMIFQDPYASLNPRHTIGEAIGEPLLIHDNKNKKERKERIIELLELVGLSPYHYSRVPHQFSGGQRQRIGIARAIANNPKLIVCDEPVSALDVSVQSQVLNLMEELKEKFDLTYIFISHDLSVVKHISDRIAVMYLGRIVEITDNETLYDSPKHPYTQALLSAIPSPDPDIVRDRIILEGSVPSPTNPPKGCSFHTRCPMVMDVCKEISPKLQKVQGNQLVSCHLY